MALKQLSEEMLLVKYVEGDFSAFEALYARHKGGVYRYLSRQIHDQSVVEDVFQDVWGQVITHAKSFNAHAKFSTWLYTIARHKLIDHIRHINVVNNVISDDSNEDEHAIDNATDSKTPESIHTQHIQAQAIEWCMQKLPTHQLDCFLLKEETGLPVADIAHIVNAGYEATKSRLRIAYRSLKQCIELKLDNQSAQSPSVKGVQ